MPAPRETYYVDVVNLPAATPRSGAADQKGESSPLPPSPQQERPQVLPAPPHTAPPDARSPRTAPPAEDDSFARRMEQLGQKAEAQRAENVLARLKARVSAQGSGRSGMPSASGSEAGSDYGAYIKSRLEDALEKTASYTSRNPEVLVRLFIAADGKVTRQKIERSSGDRSFELSVLRAIDLAAEKFPPPPGRAPYEGSFIFKPRGIAVK